MCRGLKWGGVRRRWGLQRPRLLLLLLLCPSLSLKALLLLAADAGYRLEGPAFTSLSSSVDPDRNGGWVRP